MQHLGHKLKCKTSVLTRMSLIPLVRFRRKHYRHQTNAAKVFKDLTKYTYKVETVQGSHVKKNNGLQRRFKEFHILVV